MLRFLPTLLLMGCASMSAKDAAPSYLFVQNAQSASLADGKLTLDGLSPRAVVFSDRPDRMAGHIPNSKLIRAWDREGGAFATNPPNATLSVFDDEKVVDVVVVLRNPQRDGTKLIYDVDVLGGPKSASGGPVSLFIDNLAPWPEVRHGMHDEPNVVSREGTHVNR